MRMIARTSAASLLAMAAVLASPAAAQSAPAAQDEQGVQGVAEDNAEQTAAADIIVTAQRREQRLQDVPVAITVIGGDALATSSGSGLDAVQTLVPSLTLRRGTTVANSAVVLRGVGTISFSLAAEPAVSTVIDGVVFARSGQAFGDLFDIERIEVLRGPQGTLFGKNASAGVLNIVTKAPARDFEADATVAVYEDQEYRARANVSVPLSENIRTRFSASYSYFDGHIRNVFNNKDVNGYERWGVRGVVDIDVSESLNLRIIGDYSDTNDDCCAEALGTQPTGALAGAVLATLGTAQPRGNETRQVNHNLISRTLGDTGGVSLQANLELGDHTLTSISAYRDWKTREIREGDFLSGGANYLGINQLHDDGVQQFQQLSQELRLTSPSGQFFEYQIGLFLFDVDGKQTFLRETQRCLTTTLAADATGSRPCRPGSSTFDTPAARSNSRVKLNNKAVYGQATANVTPDFRILLGARYTKDEVSFTHQRVNLIGNGGPGIANSPFPLQGNKAEESDFSYRLGAQYDFTDDVMAYATYAKGYKGPAFNVFFNMGPADILPIEAETADSYEAGLKTTLFDRRLVFNLAAFYAEYQNFQANSFRVINNSVVTNLTNAGTIRTKGFEVDFTATPTRLLTITGGVAYADSEIKEFPCPPVGAPPGCTTREGERLPLAPEWKFSVSADQRIPLPSLPFDASFGVQYAYTDDQFSSLRPISTPFAVFEQERIDSYSLVNLSLSLMSRDDRYRLTLMARNVFDESFAALITPGGPAGTFRYIIPREAERHFGASLQMKF
jgi:iron complex outermembrane receptor protein